MLPVSLRICRLIHSCTSLAGISLVLGFALIWHIWWLVVASFVSLIATVIVHTFNYQRDYHIAADTVAATEAMRTQQLSAAHV